MAEEKKKKSPLTTAMKSMLDDTIEDSVENIEPTYLETYNIGFDFALTNGKGIPLGTSVMFYAEPGCGKTTLLGDVCLRLINNAKNNKEEFKVLYIATEDSKELLKSIGLEDAMRDGTFIYAKKDWCWKQVEAFYEGVLQGYGKYKGVKLIVIDSMNTVLSEANKSKSVTEGDYGSRAKERSAFLSKYLPVCSERGITSFLITQVRQVQNLTNPYQDPKKAAAAFADFHLVEMVVKCMKKADAKDAQKAEVQTIFGEVQEQTKYIMKLNSSATSCKNRFFRGTPSEVLVVKGKGIDNTYVVRKLLEGNGYVKATGGYYSFDKTMQELLKAPKEKIRREECNRIVEANIGTIVDYLKRAGQYKLELSTEIVEGELVEDEDEDITEEIDE